MKRILLLLLTGWAGLLATAQTADNPINLEMFAEWSPSKAHVNDGIMEDGRVVLYTLQRYSGLRNYKFNLTIWREKDPLHPVYPNGNVTDWDKLEQVEFAVSPRFRNDYYVVTAPEKAPGDYTVGREFRREANWTSAFRVYLLSSFFNSIPSRGAKEVTYYLRYDIDYDSEKGKGRLSNSRLPQKQTRIRWTYSPGSNAFSVNTRVQWETAHHNEKTGLEENGWTLTFNFSGRPTNPKYDITLAFFREKDPAHPLFENDVVKDFKLTDLLQFPASLSDDYDFGREYPEDDENMAAEIYLERTGWDDLTLFIPQSIIGHFMPSYELPADVDELMVKHYITYRISYNDGNSTLSNEQQRLPWIGWKYERMTDDRNESQDAHVHDFATVTEARMYKEVTQGPTTDYQGHIFQYHPQGTITEEKKMVARNNMPQEYTFRAGASKTRFTYNYEDFHISQSPITEGLWAALFPEPEMSRGCEPGDTTWLCGAEMEEIEALVERMNEKVRKEQQPWVFSIATANDMEAADLPYVPSEDGSEEVFTPLGNIYLTAEFTGPKTVMRQRTSYAVATWFSRTCIVHKDCPLNRTFAPFHRHTTTRRSAERSLRYNENTCASWTEAELERQNNRTPKPKVKYVVKTCTYRQCSECQERESGDAVVKTREFANEEEATRYYEQVQDQ